MLFWKRSLAELTSTLAYSAAAILLALSGFGVWSLVSAYLLKTVVHMGMIWVFARWRPHFRFRRPLALEMLQYGKYIFGGSLLFFLMNNLDNVVVGRLLGLSALGFYGLSFNISSFPHRYLIGKMSGVLFPAFSTVQDDEGALCRGFLKSLKLISMIAIPFGLALLVWSPTLLRVVYGEKWLPASSVLRLLAIGGILNALGGSCGPVFLAKGRSRLDFWISLLHVGIFFVSIVPLTMLFGLNGTGVVVLLSGGISFLVGMWRVRRILPISWQDIFDSIRPSLIGSCVMLGMFGAVALGRSLWHLVSPLSTAGFILMAGLSVAAYLFSIFLLDRDVRLEVRRIV